jgi:hypothetical protein
LVFNVKFDLLLIEANGGDEVPNRPDAVFAEIHVFDEFELLSQGVGTITFQSFDGICYGHVGRDFQLNVNMVLVSVDFKEMECWVLLDGFKKGGFELSFDIGLEPFVPILCAPDNVILEFVGTVI